MAQDSFGALHSNYTPTNSVHINPSSMLDAKTWIDIHIVGAGSYTNNDFLSAKSTTLLRLNKARDIDVNDLDFRSNKRFYHIYNRSFVQVFSGVISQGDHAFGLSFGAYSFFDVRRINDTLAQILENQINSVPNDFLSSYSLDNFKSNALGYAEGKISYAYTYSKKRKEMFMIGFSFKKIFPLAGGALKIHELNYKFQNDTTFFIGNFKGDLMYNSTPEFSLKGGMGIDIGFTYQNMYDGCSSYFPNSRRNGCSRKNYKYKIGVSINDLGYAKFNPDNSEYYGYQFTEEDFDFNDLNDIDQIVNQLTGDSQNGLIRKPYKLSLPTSLSVQIDYNILPNFLYVNATWIHGVAPAKRVFGPRRAHSLSVTPRIETKWIDFAMPISLYEYRYPQMGASLRLYFITIGTDKLLNFFIPSNIYGADIYAHVKVPLFYNPKCNKKNGRSSNGRRKKGRKYPICDAYR